MNIVQENYKISTYCVHQIVLNIKVKAKTILCPESVVFLYRTRNSVNNLSSYYGLTSFFKFYLMFEDPIQQKIDKSED